MKVIVDAMGGDNAPDEIVKGAIDAAKDFGIDITLIGDKKKIEPMLPEGCNADIVHTEEVVDMADDPLYAAKNKKNSSMMLGLQMLKEGKGDAFVSAGSTGALIAGASLTVGRIKGVRRMALAAVLPTNGGRVLLIDTGANMDCAGELIAQFGLMGSLYMHKVFGIIKPRVGLLNVGVEDTKGNDAAKQAHELMKGMPINFAGNIEARDVPSNVVDVLAADGFAGNVLLKTMEGVALMFAKNLKQIFTKNALSMIGGLFVKKGIDGFKKKMDYTETGGAPLLGANGVVIKAHGSSNEKAFYHAIRQAVTFNKTGVNEEISLYFKNNKNTLD